MGTDWYGPYNEEKQLETGGTGEWHGTTGTGFTSSPLWQEALAPRARDQCAQPRERLRSAYVVTRENAAVVLSELARSMPAFTVHDVTHADALWETATLLCGNEQPLNPAETFVLGCTFLLHDAAMGLAAYPDGDPTTVLGDAKWQDLVSLAFADLRGRWPTEDELAEPPDDVRSRCLQAAVRETHAEQAARLVEQSWPTSAGNELYLIEDVQLRESYGPIIGDLAASHWWDVADLPEQFKHHRGSLPSQPPDWTIDSLKLACVLRLADAMQLDSRRAPTLLRSLRAPAGDSADHWQFQEHLSRPQLSGDRITYTALRPFPPAQARAWWLGLDYLRGVDVELRKVDALLHDLQRPRLSARAVAGVDLPERFAELFPVQGWRPVDVNLQISSVRNLVSTLGGEQLYGVAPEVAVRELLQNAQDAVQARQVLDPTFTDGHIQMSLTRDGTSWTLEVRDNGIGMDEGLIINGLLDFGRSGWRSDIVRRKFVGLSAGGFRPRGRFGIGFFSAFMIGDDITLTTRRFDGGRNDACRLQFDGLAARPLLADVEGGTYVPPGTSVRVILKNDPVSNSGILSRTREDTLGELVQRLMPESSVPVTTTEWDGYQLAPLLPFDLTTAPTAEIYDRLYPPSWASGDFEEHQRRALRDEFVQQATEVTSETGDRLGFAVFGMELAFLSGSRIRGIVTADGFRADEHQHFAGYIRGRSDKASRDNVELALTSDELAGWIRSQELRLRERGRFSVSIQLENAELMYRSIGQLSEDHHIGMAGGDVIRLADIEPWAASQRKIIWAEGLPLHLQTRPPCLIHYVTGRAVTLPENWFYLTPFLYWPEVENILIDRRDPTYECHRHDRTRTWQKRWWHRSGNLDRELFDRICQAWDCEIGDILQPVAARGWNDHETPTPDIEPLSVWRLRRP